MEKLFIIIPVRLNSNRFPNKVLKKIHGKKLIQHVWEQVKIFSNVFIATDSPMIVLEAKKFGANVILTKKNHTNGTERCNEVAKKLNLKGDDIIINVQCDELVIYNHWIKKMYNQLLNYQEEIITTVVSSKIESNDWNDKSTVKTFINQENLAMNFTRTISPNHDIKKSTYKHIGIYGYKKITLSKICDLNITIREEKEQLEQLRWLDNNFKIKCIKTTRKGFSINTKEDLERVTKQNIL